MGGGYSFGKEYSEHRWLMAMVGQLVNEIGSLRSKLKSPDEGVGGTYWKDTVAQLRTIPSSEFNGRAWTSGRLAIDDGEPTFWDWDPAGTDADDGSTVVRPNDFSGVGVWRRRL